MKCGRACRLEVAEQHRQQQHDLEALAEQDEEALGRHQRRAADAGIGQLALGLVEQAAQLDDLVADLDRAARRP